MRDTVTDESDNAESVHPFNPNGVKMKRNAHGRVVGLDWETTRPAVEESVEVESEETE